MTGCLETERLGFRWLIFQTAMHAGLELGLRTPYPSVFPSLDLTPSLPSGTSLDRLPRHGLESHNAPPTESRDPTPYFQLLL